MQGRIERLVLCATLLVAVQAEAQRMMETLNRGLIAVQTSGGTYLSWRLWGTEPGNIGFNVYKGATRLNTAPITGATIYTDNAAGTGAYTVKPVVNGAEGDASEAALVLANNYIDIALQPPSENHAPNDASAADLDGDGDYEIILKWDPNNAKDNSQAGVTDNVYLDGLKLDGTRLWRINLGPNIRAGAHYTQFMVADFDGDGKAEMFAKTADGTVDGAGTVIGSPTAMHRSSSGYVLTGPEFLTVFNGMTGKAMATTDYYPARGNVGSWGDTYGNRVDRFLAAVAWLDGSRPSAVMCRGYYTRTVLAAWDWRDGKLTQRWIFDTSLPGTPSGYTGQGNHGISVADVDEDGKDEIIYGAMAIDDNGQALWTTRLGHGDAMHVGDLDPTRPGLEIWDIHEGGSQPGADFRNARTGQVYWQLPNLDTGRGMAADISATSPGYELWTNAVGPRSPGNQPVSVSTGSTNFAAWWDGDLLRELLDGNRVSKPGAGALLTATGCSSINGTKSTPTLSADLFGDWREEVVLRTTDNRHLRIYTTTIPTTYRIYTLMHNPMYRAAIAWQNVAYNQPPHVDFYLGAGMPPTPRPNIITGSFTVGTLPRPGLLSQALPARGQLARVDGTGRIAMPLGYAGNHQTILLRDAFGRQVASGKPRNGYLQVPKGLALGFYHLQEDVRP